MCPTVVAQSVGIARASYAYALGYARDRVQFGRPIIENQAIAFALADMKMEIDAARLLVWRASWMGRNNRPFAAGEGSMSKLKAGEVAVAVTGQAVRTTPGRSSVPNMARRVALTGASGAAVGAWWSTVTVMPDGR